MTLGERVNAWIDDLLAVADRLLQLPSFAVLLGAAAVLALLAALAVRLLRRPGRGWVVPAAFATAGVLLAAVVLAAADRRLAAFAVEVQQLRARVDAAALSAAARDATAAAAPSDASAAVTTAAAPATVVPTAAAPTARSLQFDRARVDAELTAVFGDHEWQPTALDAAIDFVPITLASPLVHAWVAIVDLEAANVALELGTDLERKSLTSDFARARDCTIAINGEAGLSPFPGSGLGPWTGLLVERGKVLLAETADNARPFLWFDQQNRARLVPQIDKDRSVPADCFTAIWGRWDAVTRGEVQFVDFDNRQPRTAMGVDAAGRRLYLVVIDGRQPRWSMGATAMETAMLLRIFGARDAMLCDEGGSSCIWVKALGGIVNSPSDGEGRERPTYTHFGVRTSRG